jgi:DNA invertase Pin-like site-specific DNA recombinase
MPAVAASMLCWCGLQIESPDTGGPLGRAIVIIIGAIPELERNLIIERVRAGMRRARLEGRHIGRNPLMLDREAIRSNRCRGQCLRQIARGHRISTATVSRVLLQEAASAQQKEVA